MDKHTICLLNDSFPPIIDGVANAVVNYAENIEKHHGHAVVVTPAVPGADDSGFPFPVVRYPSIDTRRLVGYVAGYPFSPETALRVREEKVELLHTHCPIASAILARSLREVVDAPLVFTYHTKFDVDVAKLIRGRLLQESALYVLASNISACDEVWVVSRGAGENLRSIGYKGDYHVMENGVDMPRGRVSEEAVAAATAGYDLPEGVPVFLFVGRMMWYKGLRIIVDALKLLQAGGQDFRMVFIGGGADAAEVQEYAKPLGNKCIFTGAISQRETLRAWYCRADLFLFPSTYDTNGLVVREAAASDLAAVLIQGSCAAEGVTDGVDGFLIEENAGAMASKLQEICKHPECMAQVGRQAGERLYLSWGDAVKRARERYGVVVENYRMGRYEDHHKPMDGVLNAQGTMMDALARVRDLGDGLAERYREGWEEHKEEFEERREERRGERRSIRSELKQKGEALWQKLDRYL
ncbi:MAG: glycosyltransferase [Clostridiales bacterium]|nr:glycosyltransferase [Clostridiales bacterium]